MNVPSSLPAVLVKIIPILGKSSITSKAISGSASSFIFISSKGSEESWLEEIWEIIEDDEEAIDKYKYV